MKHLVILLMTCFTTVNLFGQTGENEYWRDMGYQMKLQKDYPRAISFYKKILVADADDYDAKLALARLYVLVEKYDTAMLLFDQIFRNDSTDVEAMNGLGECHGNLGHDKVSIYYYQRALSFFPEDVQQYFYLAIAYGNGGMLDAAIATYREAMKIDSTYAETWAGIGKMYYWKGMPYTAAVYYGKALDLDPGNEEYLSEYENVQDETRYGFTVKAGPVKEKEESYVINALVTSLRLEKRISDRLHLEANILVDYSNRDFSELGGDTTRWFNATWLKGSWITIHHRWSLYGGYSASDQKLSAYGLSWLSNYQLGKVAMKNALAGGYDYFYYWNKVGSLSVTDELQATYRWITLQARYAAGRVDPVLIKDVKAGTSYEHENPFRSYGVSLITRILARPDVRIGLNHSFLDYEYKSPLYYSPFGRKLTGASVSCYYVIRKFYLYGSYSYNSGTEYYYDEDDRGKFKKTHLDVDNWSSNIEAGYNHHPFSISLGGSTFYNPYYRNITGFISVRTAF
jgi:tetratricopeptide (TPR) repeat protein